MLSHYSEHTTWPSHEDGTTTRCACRGYIISG